MGWTNGPLDVPFSARSAIEFDLGEEFARRVIDTARFGTVIYAAVRSKDDADQVFGLVLLAERRDGLVWTKPISEDMGPAEDCCPVRILDLLTEPSNDCAHDWRERCRARIARGRPRRGQKVTFERPIGFTDGTEHRVLTFVGGSRFRTQEGELCRIPSWQTLNYRLRAAFRGASR
jgi:hypothetical protein